MRESDLMEAMLTAAKREGITGMGECNNGYVNRTRVACRTLLLTFASATRRSAPQLQQLIVSPLPLLSLATELYSPLNA